MYEVYWPSIKYGSRKVSRFNNKREALRFIDWLMNNYKFRYLKRWQNAMRYCNVHYNYKILL